MGNRRLHKIECVQAPGTPESERLLKGTALNLFHPTASLPFGNDYDTASRADGISYCPGLSKGGRAQRDPVKK